MSKINCNACEELRDTSPAYVQNGVSKAICASLANDIGLNPSLSHIDETDMHNINDCMIGRMAQEIEAFDVCDWKEFMHKFIPNLYEFLKAVNCLDGGQWKNIHDLWAFAQDICEKTDMIMSPTTYSYGTFPYYDEWIDKYPSIAYKLGTINTKNGQPLMAANPVGEIPERNRAVAGPGIEYNKRQLTSCTGNCMIYEWIKPHFYLCHLNANVEKGDVLWYCDKATFKAVTGCTETLWKTFTKLTDSTPNAGGGWRFELNPLGNHKNGWVYLWADPEGMGEDVMVLEWAGTSYPDEDPGTQMGILSKDQPYVVRSNC